MDSGCGHRDDREAGDRAAGHQCDQTGRSDRDAAAFRLAVHGPGVEVECGVPELRRAVGRLLGAFATPDMPDGFAPTVGSVQPYDPDEVAKYLSPTACRMPAGTVGGTGGELLDVFEEGERFWIVDDRWGLAEINLLRGTWRSWVLPQPRLDTVRCVELAVLWPLAQLLRGKGVHLVPAVSAVRDGWAALILCPFGIEPELKAMLRAGYRLIGQRWTAVREEEGRLALLHMPGLTERPGIPRLEIAWSDELDGAAERKSGESGWANDLPGWADLTAEHRGGWQQHAFCDAVLVVEPSRRPRPQMRRSPPAATAAVLRQAWPIAELHPSRRPGQLSARFARQCRCFEVQLSRDPRDLLDLLRSASLELAPALGGDGEPLAPRGPRAGWAA